MKVGLVGLGGAVQRGHLPALSLMKRQKLVRTVVGCDPDRAARRQSKSRLQGAYGCLDDMLHDGTPDVIVICVPPSEQEATAERLSDLSCHLIYEKPIGFMPGGYEALCRRSASHPDRGIAVVNQYRFASGWQELLTWLMRDSAVPEERVSIKVSVRRPEPDPHAQSDWRRDPHNGGLIADHGSHFVGLANTLSPVVEARAAKRFLDVNGVEQASASVWLEHGRLELDMRCGDTGRSTTVIARRGDRLAAWSDWRLQLGFARAGWIRESVTAPLSNRQVVDSLYAPWYRMVISSYGRVDDLEALRSEALAVAKVMHDLGARLRG